MIELKGIVREYRNGDVVTPALTGIDLCIGKGEFAAVMGASGSGKTTLLHIIDFNPRSRTGSDKVRMSFRAAHHIFQSTLPHGERPVRLR